VREFFVSKYPLIGVAFMWAWMSLLYCLQYDHRYKQEYKIKDVLVIILVFPMNTFMKLAEVTSDGLSRLGKTKIMNITVYRRKLPWQK